VGDLAAFQTFLRLCAGRTGQLVNLSGLASDCGISHGTARAWLSVLETSFVVTRVPPLLANVNKRLVRTPKMHFLDSGLACWLLGITRPEQLQTHPLRGAVFETWVASEVLKARLNRGLPAGLAFYRDRKGLEADLVVESGSRRVVIEAKSGRTVAADFTASLDRVAEILARDAARPDVERVVVYGGDRRFRVREAVMTPWSAVADVDWA
jgi:predicted AAA+ superfamily ATPase